MYSLGVVLFELLTGSRPYRITRTTRSALEEAILHAEPQRPSDIVAAPLRKTLRGDLDTILLKTLKKDPRERYATVNALYEDIARYLDHRPVLAQPDSSWYRAAKFVRRNRLAVAATATILVAIVAAAAISSWQAEVAIREKQRAQEVQKFIEDIFGNANPYGDPGRTMTAVELLRNARTEVDRKFAARKDLRVTLLDLIGSSFTGLSEFPEAESALNAALADSLALYGPEHIVTVRTRALLAEVHTAQFDKAKLRADLATLVPLARSQVSIDAEPLVRALKDEGYLAFLEGRLEEIATPVSEAFDLARARLGDRHPLTVEVSTLLGEAYTESYQTRPDEVLRQTGRALAFALAAYGEHSNHAQVIRARSVHARALGLAGSYHEAIAQERQALDALARAVGLKNRMSVDMKNSMSGWERRVGEISNAVADAGESLQILEGLGDTHSADYAAVLNDQGLNLLSARRLQDAQAMLERGQALNLELYGPTHWGTLTARFNLAMARAFDGKGEAALSSFDILDDRSIKLSLPWWVAYAHGTVARLAHRPQLAVAELERSLDLIPQSSRAQWDRVRVLTELGQARLDFGQADAASKTLEEALAIDEELKIAEHPAYAEARAALERAHRQLGR